MYIIASLFGVVIACLSQVEYAILYLSGMNDHENFEINSSYVELFGNTVVLLLIKIPSYIMLLTCQKEEDEILAD